MTRKWYTPEHSQSTTSDEGGANARRWYPAPTGLDPIASEKESFKFQERVEYNDGAVNLLFAEQGDKVVWGEHKYANPELSPIDRIIVRTENDGVYILGDGLAISARYLTVYELDKATERLPDITIGKPWEIPGYMSTGDIKNVELRWKIGEGFGDRMIDRPDPFILAENYIKAATKHIGRE